MTRVLIIAVPSALAVYALSMSQSPGTVLLALASVALPITGAALGRYLLVSLGAAASGINYLGSLASGRSAPDFWGALLVGLGMYLLLEIGYDQIVVFRGAESGEAYRGRQRYLYRSLGVALVVGLVVVILAVNFTNRFPPFDRRALAVPGAVLAIGGVVFLIKNWFR